MIIVNYVLFSFRDKFVHEKINCNLVILYLYVLSSTISIYLLILHAAYMYILLYIYVYIHTYIKDICYPRSYYISYILSTHC